MDPPFIRFNVPTHTGREAAYVSEVLQNGHLAGDGPFTRACQALLERETGTPKALLTTSCTHALELAALLLDLQPGDEVIVPSFTFVTTVNAFVLRGARPVFVDIRPDTLNLDESLVASKVTSRTRAIFVVHYAGVACEMDELLAVAARHNLAVVEDNAHGLFGSYKGRPLGTMGSLGTLSFHETKNFTCGEGGALLINDPAHGERAEIIREKGTNRSRFFRGLVDKYTWVDVGSSYLPSEILAAFLLAQLEARGAVQAKRRWAWETYFERLQGLRDLGVRLPTVPAHCEQSYHLFYLILRSLEERQEMIAFLKSQGIGSAFHYLPLHLSDMGRRLGGKPGDCPVTEDLSDRLLRLPFHNHLAEGDLERVTEAVERFFRKGS